MKVLARSITKESRSSSSLSSRSFIFVEPASTQGHRRNLCCIGGRLHPYSYRYSVGAKQASTAGTETGSKSATFSLRIRKMLGSDSCCEIIYSDGIFSAMSHLRLEWVNFPQKVFILLCAPWDSLYLSGVFQCAFGRTLGLPISWKSNVSIPYPMLLCCVGWQSENRLCRKTLSLRINFKGKSFFMCFGKTIFFHLNQFSKVSRVFSFFAKRYVSKLRDCCEQRTLDSSRCQLCCSSHFLIDSNPFIRRIFVSRTRKRFPVCCSHSKNLKCSFSPWRQ